MLREIRLYWAVKVQYKALSRDWSLFQMNLTINSFIQLLGTVGQTLNVIGGFVPADKKMYVAAGIALLQGIAAAVAHFSNPAAYSPLVKRAAVCHLSSGLLFCKNYRKPIRMCHLFLLFLCIAWVFLASYARPRW